MKILFLVLVVLNGIHTNGFCRSRIFVGGTCFNNTFQQVQRIVQFPTVNYFVGAPIRVQAIIRQELSSSRDYQEFLQFKQWKAQVQQPLQRQIQQIQPQSLKQRHCAKCHTGQKPKGEFSIDGIFTALERDKAARLVILNKMPKGVQLSPAEKGELIKEILTTDVE